MEIKMKNCWNCGSKVNKLTDEINKYHCPKDQMDFIFDIDSIEITYQK